MQKREKDGRLEWKGDRDSQNGRLPVGMGGLKPMVCMHWFRDNALLWLSLKWIVLMISQLTKIPYFFRSFCLPPGGAHYLTCRTQCGNHALAVFLLSHQTPYSSLSPVGTFSSETERKAALNKLENSVMTSDTKFYNKKTKVFIIFSSSRNKSANALALCHPPSANFCSVLAVQWSSRIFTHDRYNIPNDILIESN